MWNLNKNLFIRTAENKNYFYLNGILKKFPFEIKPVEKTRGHENLKYLIQVQGRLKWVYASAKFIFLN